MAPPPDFSSLSSAEKDALILALLARVDAPAAARCIARLNPGEFAVEIVGTAIRPSNQQGEQIREMQEGRSYRPHPPPSRR